jgi:hypothetical protein
MSDESLVIEFPASGETYLLEEYGVYRYSVYPPSSVLAGRQRRTSLGAFPTLAAAREAFPDASYQGEGAGHHEAALPETAPDWFDEADAGERWNDDY